ncbi:MAG: hypothetical protein K0R18_156 [Bacillales bacterium]|jgi:hypothetical protein|nr:hypothetical protein [Bacillales bacterium]
MLGYIEVIKMPISPKEALTLTNDDKQVLERTQSIIDKYVLENFTGDTLGLGGSIQIPFENFSSIKSKIKREITKNYIAAGWKQADFTDGRFHLSTYEKSSYGYNGRD